MTQQGQYGVLPKNYYAGTVDSLGGLHYRIDANDMIHRVIETLSGKVTLEDGTTIQETSPLMNNEGIGRCRAFLQGTITKITHLSRYQNEERVNRQLRHYVRVWIYEVVRNMKIWAPENENKIKHPRIVVAEVEKALHESMLRAIGGSEAELTAKSWHVTEAFDRKEREERTGGFFNPFKKKQDG